MPEHLQSLDPTPPQRPFEPPNVPAEDIFLGPDGLRSGWGLLIFGILFLALSYGIGHLLLLIVPRLPLVDFNGQLHPLAVLLSEATVLLAMLLATLTMSLLEHRPLADYGLARTRALPRALLGALAGLALLSLLVAALHFSGFLTIGPLLLAPAAALRSGLVWLAAFVLVGLYEEIFFRGYLQATLTRALTALFALFELPQPQIPAFWTSAVILSLGFGLVHTGNTGESVVGEIAAGCISLVFCLSLRRSGSLWWAIGFHTAWDWAESFLYSTYDSGMLAAGRLLNTTPHGSPLLSGAHTGPEGSLFVLPTLLLAALLIATVFPLATRQSASPVTGSM